MACDTTKCGDYNMTYVVGSDSVTCSGMTSFQAWVASGGEWLAEMTFAHDSDDKFEDQWTKLAVPVPEQYQTAAIHVEAALGGGIAWLIDACEISIPTENSTRTADRPDCREASVPLPRTQWKRVGGSELHNRRAMTPQAGNTSWFPSARRGAATWTDNDTPGVHQVIVFAGLAVDDEGHLGTFLMRC